MRQFPAGLPVIEVRVIGPKIKTGPSPFLDFDLIAEFLEFLDFVFIIRSE